MVRTWRCPHAHGWTSLGEDPPTCGVLSAPTRGPADARTRRASARGGVHMKIIAVVSQKGGAGKTTLAVHLAVAAAHSGYSVAIIDLDQQATAAQWADWREGDNVAVVAAPHGRLGPTLAEARQQRRSRDHRQPSGGRLRGGGRRQGSRSCSHPHKTISVRSSRHPHHL